MTPRKLTDAGWLAFLVATGNEHLASSRLRGQFGSWGEKIIATGAKPGRRKKKKPITYDVSDFKPAGITWAGDVKEEKIRWLWHGRIPLANVCLLDGDPDLGKSTLTIDIAARHSSGRAFPFQEGGDHQEPGNVLIVSAEDHYASIIVPRLRAAGANMDRVAFLNLREDKTGKPLPFSVPEDLDRLRDAIWEGEATLVIIDPMTAFISAKIHSHNDASIRKAMLPLTLLAQDTGAAIVGLRHLNKDDNQTKALYRGGGSIGFTGNARSVLLAARKPDGDGVNVLAQTKSNLFRRGQIKSLEWCVVSWDKEPEIPRIKWVGTSDLSSDELLKQFDRRYDSPARKDAEALWQKALTTGPQPSKRVHEEAKELGISSSVLKRARKKLQVHTYRSRKSSGETEAWWVHLPQHPCPEGAECQW